MGLLHYSGTISRSDFLALSGEAFPGLMAGTVLRGYKASLEGGELLEEDDAPARCWRMLRSSEHGTNPGAPDQDYCTFLLATSSRWQGLRLVVA